MVPLAGRPPHSQSSRPGRWRPQLSPDRPRIGPEQEYRRRDHQTEPSPFSREL